jgi:hypothetical protein
MDDDDALFENEEMERFREWLANRETILDRTYRDALQSLTNREKLIMDRLRAREERLSRQEAEMDRIAAQVTISVSDVVAEIELFRMALVKAKEEEEKSGEEYIENKVLFKEGERDGS